MFFVFALMSLTSCSTILSFSPCSTVNLVTLSAIAPVMFGKSEMLSEEAEDGDVMIERSSVSPNELVDSEFESLRCSLGPAGVGGWVLSVRLPG